jgi:hypothetical protein
MRTTPGYIARLTDALAEHAGLETQMLRSLDNGSA